MEEWMDEQVDRQVRKAALAAPSGGQSNNFINLHNSQSTQSFIFLLFEDKLGYSYQWWHLKEEMVEKRQFCICVMHIFGKNTSKWMTFPVHAETRRLTRVPE